MPSSQCCLPATGLIANLTQEDRDDLSSYGTFHNAKPETVLIEEGKPHGKLFYTISGHLEARRMDHGKEVLLGSIRDGDWIGEVDILDPSSAMCSVITVEETQYWEISRQELEKFINKNTSAGSVLLIGLAATLGRRIREVTSKHATAPVPKKKPYILLGALAVSIVAIVATLFLVGKKQEEIIKLKQPSRGLAQLQEALDFSRQRTIELEAEYAKINADLKSKAEEAQKSKGELESLKAQEKALENQRQGQQATANSSVAVSKPTDVPSAPALTTQAKAVPASSPQQTNAAPGAAAPVNSDPVAGYTPLEFPPEVTLLEQMTIPLKVGSKVSGSLKLATGRVLQVTGVDKGDLLVDMGASTERIPKDKTDFNKALAKADLAAKEQYKLRQQFEHHLKNSQQGVDPKLEEKNAPSLVQKPASISEPAVPSEKKEFTFAEIEKIVQIVEPLKTLKALKDQKKEAVLRSEAHKWHQAAEITKSYFQDFKDSGVPQAYTHWLKTVLTTAEMIDSGRYDTVEAKLRELDLEWLNLKADNIVGKSESQSENTRN